jgi:hypothetical protein
MQALKRSFVSVLIATLAFGGALGCAGTKGQPTVTGSGGTGGLPPINGLESLSAD